PRGRRGPGAGRRPVDLVRPPIPPPVLGDDLARGPARRPRHALLRAPRRRAPPRAAPALHGRVGVPGGGRARIRRPRRVGAPHLLAGRVRPPGPPPRRGDGAGARARRGRSRAPTTGGSQGPDPARRVRRLRRAVRPPRWPRGRGGSAPPGG